MKIDNIKLSREQKQIIKGSKLLSVSVNQGNLIASVLNGAGEIELAIVKDEAPENAKFFATLNEGHMVSHVFVIAATQEKEKK